MADILTGSHHSSASTYARSQEATVSNSFLPSSMIVHLQSEDLGSGPYQPQLACANFVRRPGTSRCPWAQAEDNGKAKGQEKAFAKKRVPILAHFFPIKGNYVIGEGIAGDDDREALKQRQIRDLV
ncbi:hypothetical protein CC1G_14457 [Coprinopsis cinerea okayama7|uniref:Uncharacterized protein n=1 Tax=Coprinopsis cinerea (strain Okayama-7 / 130 / ATCC MYA-4618 / FGSC 9003) TaxID=240176 RepID=D6RM36_COPC7|nr:hypothetical protein CC1G_14457 [Coprinopsis cinerea okayama7\|eukprot:XP_002911459.1 hypothetical protein CC1G_14457 [Coprinopsis cinerea okayama7\